MLLWGYFHAFSRKKIKFILLTFKSTPKQHQFHIPVKIILIHIFHTS